MNTRCSFPLRTVVVAAGALTFAVGVSGVAAASSDTEPADDTHAEATHAEMSAPAAIVEAGEPTSPEAEAFCAAELGAEQAFVDGDEEAIGAAVETLIAAAPEDVAPAVEAAIAGAGEAGPEFEAAYAEVIDYMKANCGYAQLEVAASDYAFGGLPAELPAGPMIVGLTNIGEEVHEIAIVRINDDVDLSVEELLELPEEEVDSMTAFVGIAFTFPGNTGYAVVDLAPGRYVALCFLPEGATPEVLMELEELGVGGPDDTLPEGGPEVGPPHFTLGMIHEFTVA